MRIIPWRIGNLLGVRPSGEIKNLSSDNSKYQYNQGEFRIEFNDYQHKHAEETDLPPIFYTYTKKDLLRNHSNFGLVECRNASFLHIYGFDAIVVKGNILGPLSYKREYLEPYRFEIHPILTIEHYPRARRLKGKTLCLATMGAQTAYGEWVTNLIPRIAIAEYFGFYFRDFDNIICNFNDYPWQKQLIELMQIPFEKIILFNEGEHYKIDHLFAPTYSPHSMLGFQYIQDKLTIPFSNKHLEPHRRIYLSRKNESRLRIRNEEELVKLLLDYSFEILDITKLPIVDQIKLMDEVEVLVSCQGSGLTNVLFMKSNTKVIEIHNVQLPNPHFNHYGIYKNIDYYNLMAEPYTGSNIACVELECDLNKLQRLLQLVL